MKIINEIDRDWLLMGIPDSVRQQYYHDLRELDDDFFTRPEEMTCEQCTDGLDNNLNGLTDEEQASCKVWVQWDPTCSLSAPK